MNIIEAITHLEKNDIPVLKSNRKGFDYFIQDTMDDIPISDAENEDTQSFGVHMLEKEIIEFAETV